MESPDLAHAIDVALSIAVSVGLPADDASVIHNSNKLALRLLPCDVFARVAPAGHQNAAFEVELAQRLAETRSPVAALEPRVQPRGYLRDGFEVTFWVYYEPVTREIGPAAYADALERLHAGMRRLDTPTPHFTDRVAEAQDVVRSRDNSPALPDADRGLLASTLQRLRRSIGERGNADQVLHGEPHHDNLVSTATGPLFVDLETCCRGPVEFDLAHVPVTVSSIYRGVDQMLLDDCRELVLAMVAAWRWVPGDQLPNGIPFGRELVNALRDGPPWPTIDDVFERLPPSSPGKTERGGEVTDCVMCDRAFLRGAEVYFENDFCVYASTRDPRDPADVLPGSGIVIPIAHRPSPFDCTPQEWAAMHDVLIKAKAAWDARLAPDGYFLSWTCFPTSAELVADMHAHLHVVPRFDDEPYADRGGRTAIKQPGNRRPDPFAPGTGRAKLFGDIGGSR